MSYNNELYIFSEVPGYDASKGERIVKAFQKLRTKIEYLEQVRISEKNACSLKVQSNNDSELTITDVQSEILLTQIRYIIKIVKEFANDQQTNLDVTNNAKGEQETKSPLSNNSEKKTIPVNDDCSNPNEPVQIETSVVPSNSEAKSHKKQGNYSDVVTSTHTSQKQNHTTDSEVRVSHKHSKLSNPSHYHLKLDDVPFILGASSSASHSVVANVQNIIAMMKSHNRALCAPKQQNRSRKCSSTHVNKSETGDANDMIRQLSEDLTDLAQRQEKLKEMFDNPRQSRFEETKSEVRLRGESSCQSKLKKQLEGNSPDVEKCMLSNLSLKDKKQSTKKHSEMWEASQKHSVVSIRMQSNNNPQLARRKMLRSLKDFKRHLSEEDISWE